MLFRKEPDFDT